MKFVRLLCVVCGLVSCVFAVDREAFTFTAYNLELRIEPEQHRVGARGTITLRNDSAVAQKILVLQISSSLNWRAIEFDGKSVPFDTRQYASDIDHTGALSEASVTLPKEVPPKGSIELQVGYEGVIRLDATRLTRIGVPEEKALHADWDQISTAFTGVRGAGYVVWYPVATEGASLADGRSVFETLGRWKQRETDAEMRTTFCASRSQSHFITTGFTQISDVSPAEGSQDTAWQCMSNRALGLGVMVPVILIVPYQLLDYAHLSIAYAPSHKAGAEAYGAAAEQAVPLLSDWFKPARQKGKVTELPDQDAAAFEAGITLLTPLDRTDPAHYQLTAVHQLTHTAFHALRPWVYEGVAHFVQALWLNQQNGLQAALDFMEEHRAALVDAEKSAAKEPNHDSAQSLTNTTVEEFYRSKAMYVWWMLRDMLGDQALKKTFASYYWEEDHDPAYLPHLIQTSTSRDLQWFFDDWVYHDRGLPDFRVASVYSRHVESGGFLVTITIENLGEAGAEVPVVLKYEGGDIRQRVEVRGKARASVLINATATPLEVVVNDGSVPESDISNNTYKIESSDK